MKILYPNETLNAAAFSATRYKRSEMKQTKKYLNEKMHFRFFFLNSLDPTQSSVDILL